MDYIVRGYKELFQITSSYNQDNKEYVNISRINLGECEDLLKEAYNIDKKETLIIFKLEFYLEGINIPIIKFDVYNPITKELLDLKHCKSVKIISPVSIDENILFKYDPTNDYYNDICYTYTTENGTDIVLLDRKNEFNKNNMSLCERGCNFIEYNSETKNVICECDIQNRSPLQLEDIINKEKLLNNFVDIKSISNINIIKCYETLFSKDGLINNIGNYILLSIILIYIISLLLFIIKGFSLLTNKINNIIKNKKFNNNNIKNSNDNSIDKKNEKEKEDEKVKDDEKEKDNEKEKDYENNKVNEKDKDNDIDNENDKDKNKIIIIKNPPKKKVKVKGKKKIIIASNNLIESNSVLPLEKSKGLISLKEENKNNNNKDLSILNTRNDYKEEQNTEDFISYNDYELNSFSYKDALVKDKRTCLQNYISLVKTKHLLVFSFYPTNDYNSQIIKICLFFFSFALYYIVNAFFFNDSTMHKIYEDEGIFNFIYFIPQILYSTIISSIINIIVRKLSLSESDILKIKQEKSMEKTKELIPKIKRCLIIKFILFFFISFLFLGIFWYFISCFGAVYKNTQIHLLNDTLISFGLSLVFPFIIFLVIVLIRYPTINKKQKCLEVCYKISQLIA